MFSGYKVITPIQVANVLLSLEKKQITGQCLRIYFASVAAVAVREAASRSQTRKGRKPKELAHYRIEELKRLTDMPVTAVKRSLARLKRAGLLSASEGGITFNGEPLLGSEEILENLSCGRSPRRPVPFPRSMLRFLAKERSLSVTKTVLGYALRGLSIARKGGEVSGKGSVKVSWLTEVLGISERSARSARQKLIQLGWIDRDSGSTQRKLNRTGAYFSINLDWTFVKRGKECGEEVLNSAPPASEKCSDFAPPYKDKKTSIEDKNQEARPVETPGVCLKEEDAPRLSDVKPSDLCHFGRLESLYKAAVNAKWIEPCEASVLNFIAAAVRAREVGRDPARVFVSIVRRKLWMHITNAEEERARRTLMKFRERDPERFRLPIESQAAA